MHPSLDDPPRTAKNWIYATLNVLDGGRSLKPTHVCFNDIRFAEPPRLTSKEIEIIVVNGDVEQHHKAIVLPHDVGATLIPIRLVR